MDVAGTEVDAFRAFEVTGWDQEGRPEAYHRFFGQLTSRAIEPLLEAVGAGTGIRLLDVGTGPGYVAAAAAARGASAVGVAAVGIQAVGSAAPAADPAADRGHLAKQG